MKISICCGIGIIFVGIVLGTSTPYLNPPLHTRARLGEYLDANHQKSIGSLLGSFKQVNKTALASDHNARLQKLAYLRPEESVDTEHLDRQTINRLPREDYTLRDIKMFPLYLTKKRGYMIIDPDFYFRKNYYGPFFELRTNTSLKNRLDFNSYSSQVSQSLEVDCFRPIFTFLCDGLPGKVKVDDGTPNAPDGYCRVEKLIFVFEYKASIFPESLIQTEDVKNISKFLDTKFVISPDGKKGVTQLSQKLETLYSGGYTDDPLDLSGEKDQYRVYPIIIHHDFYFSLPGVNNYLLEKFESTRPKNQQFDVMPLVVMNLSVFYDLLTSNFNLALLDRLLIEYYQFRQQSTIALYTDKLEKQNHFLAANMSFDEYFGQYILGRLGYPADDIRKQILNELMRRAGISFDEFNKPFDFG